MINEFNISWIRSLTHFIAEAVSAIQGRSDVLHERKSINAGRINLIDRGPRVKEEVLRHGNGCKSKEQSSK